MTRAWAAIAEEHRPRLRALVEERIIPIVDESERTQLFPAEVFNLLGDAGFLAIGAPKDEGGLGGGRTAEAMVVQELARASAGITMSVVPFFIVRIAVFEFGSPRAIEEVGRELVRGRRVVGICMSEPDAGSDVASIRTRAVRDGDGWRLSGAKMFITNGTLADDLLVVARTDDPESGKGIGLFLLDTDQPGFQARKLDKAASRGSDTTELWFDGCYVPGHRVVGHPAEGFRKAMRVLNGERILSAARAIALAQHAWEDAVEWAASHRIGDVPALALQTFQGPLAAVRAQLWPMGLALDEVCRLWDAGEAAVQEISMLKEFATKGAVEITGTIQRLMGRDGHRREARVSRNARDARLGTVAAGSEQIMHRLIASSENWPKAVR